jgi:hypothetical protein
MPPTPVVKVVVTHRAAARAKYGAAGWARIRRAVTQLKTADNARGVTTRFFALDSAADCRKVGATRLASSTDAAAAKTIVDRVYAAWAPAYLLILGGPELVGQHALANPLWTGDPNDDPDQFISSDLPYACDSPASPTVGDFRGPTRAVGRLPDLVGVTDPDVLVDLLRSAAQATPRASGPTTPVFALSTKTWKVSTQLTLGKLAGVSGTVLTCPPNDVSWTAAELAPTVHLVNCHGAEFDPRWYGEARLGQQDLPPAMDARLLGGLVPRGSVVAAECCYGAAHWPPAAAGGQAGIAATLLRQGASGVFGSANISYGPAAANEYADVICQLFLSEILAGASLGRAALTARQRFVQGQSFLDPTDLKTLGQFDLLGDPSVHPIAPAGQPVPSPGRGSPGTPVGPAGPHAAARSSARPHGVPAGVAARREVLTAVGHALASTAIACDDVARPRTGLSKPALAGLLGYHPPAATRIRTFDAGRAARPKTMRRGPQPQATTPQVAHVAFVPADSAHGRSLVVVRAEPGAAPEVRVVVPR